MADNADYVIKDRVEAFISGMNKSLLTVDGREAMDLANEEA